MAECHVCADYKQLANFNKKLERLARVDFDRFCRAAAKELAARLLAKVIKRTPVGKKPRFQNADGSEKPRTLKVTSTSGKSKRMLSREGAILERYWSDYAGGTLRRGWTAKTEQEAQSGSGKDATTYAKSLPVAKVGEEYTIEVLNPVSYASYVEYGHRQASGRYVPALGKRLKNSWVRGRFMLTISEQELRAEAPALLERKLQEYLKEALG